MEKRVTRLIEVTMGEQTCGECPCLSNATYSGYCRLLKTVVSADFTTDEFPTVPNGYPKTRCPACLEKYGTDGLTNEGRYPIVADVDQKYGTGDRPCPWYASGDCTPAKVEPCEGCRAPWPKPDPRDVVVEAARKYRIKAMAAEQAGAPGIYVADRNNARKELFAALDAEGGKG